MCHGHLEIDEGTAVVVDELPHDGGTIPRTVAHFMDSIRPERHH